MKTRKIFALALAVMMMLALAANTFAADTYTITINNSVEGYTYEAYQIFTGKLEDGILSDIQWGASINPSATGKTALGDAAKYAEDTLEAIATADGAKAIADTLAGYLTTAFATTNEIKSKTEGEGDNAVTTKWYELSNLPAGYYLVKNSAVPAGTDTAYTDYILAVVEDTTVSPKGGVPSVEKKIVEGENKVDINEASIGDVVNYEIVGTMPSNIAEYDKYYYEFKDTLSSGLTFNDDIKVMIGEVDVTAYFYKDETSGAITVSIQDLLALTFSDAEAETPVTAIVDSIDANTKVVVTYTATLNVNAIVGANENEVSLIYSNDPNVKGKGTTTPPDYDNPPEGEEPPAPPESTDPTGETPKDKVATYTTQITINKVDENSAALAGAAFKLTGDNVNIVVTTGEIFVESATGSYYKLNDGTYTTTPATETTTGSYASTTVKYEKKTVVNTGNYNYYEEATDGTYYKKADGTYTTVAPTAETEDDYDDTTKKYKAVNYEVEGFVDSNGVLIFKGLGAGKYTLTETVVPKGYNSLSDFEFTVVFDAANKSFSATSPSDVAADAEKGIEAKSAVTVANDKLSLLTTIVNQSGSVLPETGGIGTTIFTIVGSILVVGAAVLLITKKRMKVNG